MAKWFGEIGFGETSETSPGVWTETVTSRKYYGDFIRNSRRLQTSSEKVNDDLNISNQLSIVADPYATKNFHMMRYATVMNAKWKITDVEVQYPRLILTLGGVYNAH